MVKRDLFEESLTRSVIGAFYDVYNTLGDGFLERIYVMPLERELRWRRADSESFVMPVSAVGHNAKSVRTHDSDEPDETD